MISQSKGKMRQDVLPLPIPGLDMVPWKDTSVKRLAFALVEVPRIDSAIAELADDRHGRIFIEDASLQVSTSEAIQSENDKLADEIDIALERGRVQGCDEANAEFERQLAGERMKVLNCCTNFQLEREKYFAAVEEQVVKLALEIAKRVLHREVNFDPMVLQGVVNFAITKVSEESGTVLRVPAEDAEKWREQMRKHEAIAIEVREEAGFAGGECILDTRVGRIELGVSAQLEEIEREFYDLLQQRPA